METNEQIEKMLIDTGVKELMEQKIQAAETGQTQETQAEVQTTTTETPPAQAETPPVVTTEKEETPVGEVDIWKDVTTTEVKVDKDWQKEFEKAQAEYSSLKEKIEKDAILKNLFELHDAPDFDPEKFIESYSKKKVDFTQFPVENLYKQSLHDDKIADYTPEEIDQMWEKKKEEIEQNPLLGKSLKSQLVREFEAKQPKEMASEPEIFKTWRESKQQQQARLEAARNEQLEIANGIKQFSESLVGKKIAGEIEITKADAEAISDKMDANYYKGKDGKLDTAKLALDRLKAVKFDEMVTYYKTQYKKDAVIEARKEIAKPNRNESGGGQMLNTDTRDNATKVIQDAMTQMGLPTDLVIGN